MRPNKTKTACLLIVSVAGASLTFAPASATLLFFQWQGSAIQGQVLSQSSWYQEAAPTPISSSFMAETDIAVQDGKTRVTGSIGGQNVDFTDNFSLVSFYNENSQEMYRANDDFGTGGFSAGDGIYASSPGPQIYTGLETDPTFGPAMFQLKDGRLTVTTVNSVPEPSTWITVLIGFGVLGFVRRRKEAMGWIARAWYSCEGDRARRCTCPNLLGVMSDLRS